MRKTPLLPRTDDQLKVGILERLSYLHSTRGKIAETISTSNERMLPLLNKMIEDGSIESYRGKSAGRSYDLYCLAGQRPRPPDALKIKMWPQTLAGFRQAVQAAYATGVDPFGLAAA